MIDHICIDVTDFNKSKIFYQRVLAPIGYSIRMEFDQNSNRKVNLVAFGDQPKPSFWIRHGKPLFSYCHIAFSASSNQLVEDFYQAAIAAGGICNGKPGMRPEYHKGYFGAFILDPDGYNIEVVHHDFS